MKRRNWLKQASLAAASVTALSYNGLAAIERPEKRKRAILKIAHITDVHIRPEENAIERFKNCLNEIKKHKVDFFLNGGDSVYAVDYNHIKRERVHELWNIWENCIQEIEAFPIYSCIGNHDIWWAAPTKDDEMYGKEYVIKRLKIPARYYSFSQKGWHFIVLDGNNKSVSLDEEQMQWLKNELKRLAPNTPVLVLSHYPILGVTPYWEGGMHSDYKELKTLFYEHRDKVKICLSGHNHLLDSATYNGVQYFCNGAMSGFWWEKGNEKSAGRSFVEETPPGYAIISLYADGTVENQYIPHAF
jgi:3',5'-cyclic AMP phosphodiesterase CpdA